MSRSKPEKDYEHTARITVGGVPYFIKFNEATDNNPNQPCHRCEKNEHQTGELEHEHGWACLTRSVQIVQVYVSNTSKPVNPNPEVREMIQTQLEQHREVRQVICYECIIPHITEDLQPANCAAS